VPANPTLAALKASRVNQRLIGTFAFTHAQRAFYGTEYRREMGNLTLDAVAALPTRGVFQVDSWGVMKAAFAYGSVTGRSIGREPRRNGGSLASIMMTGAMLLRRTTGRLLFVPRMPARSRSGVSERIFFIRLPVQRALLT